MKAFQVLPLRKIDIPYSFWGVRSMLITENLVIFICLFLLLSCLISNLFSLLAGTDCDAAGRTQMPGEPQIGFDTTDKDA